MGYQPTQDDLRCPNCREWFHKALKACPMCDTPNVPIVAPVLLAPVAVIAPQPAPYEHPAAPFTDRHTRHTAIVAASCVCAVLLIWTVARVVVIREETRQQEEIYSKTKEMMKDLRSLPISR
jgi:hypothetical protein